MDQPRGPRGRAPLLSGRAATINSGLRLALEAVLADRKEHSLHRVVTVSDHLSGPQKAAATPDLLIVLGSAHILGNHDRRLLHRTPEKMGPSDRTARRQLTAQHLDGLAAMQAKLAGRLDWAQALATGYPLR